MGDNNDKANLKKDPSDCVKQTKGKYVSAKRKGPPYPANECCGETKMGNNGMMYVSKPNEKGICRWYKVTKKPAKKPAKKSPKKQKKQSQTQFEVEIKASNKKIGDAIQSRNTSAIRSLITERNALQKRQKES